MGNDSIFTLSVLYDPSSIIYLPDMKYYLVVGDISGNYSIRLEVTKDEFPLRFKISDNNVFLSWDTMILGALNYIVKRSTNSDMSGSVILDSTSELRYVDQNLALDTYYYQIDIYLYHLLLS